MGLNWGTKHKAGLKQDIYLGSGHKYSIKNHKFLVINRVGVFGSGLYNPTQFFLQYVPPPLPTGWWPVTLYRKLISSFGSYFPLKIVAFQIPLSPSEFQIALRLKVCMCIIWYHSLTITSSEYLPRTWNTNEQQQEDFLLAAVCIWYCPFLDLPL